MKLFAVVLVALFVAGASSIALEEEQRQVLRGIRNVCVVESGLSPLELGNIFRAIRPTKKLAEATRCVIQKIVDLQDDNEVVGEIVNRGKDALANAPLPKIANNVLASCQSLLGPQGCAQVVELAAKIVDTIRSQQSLLRQ